MKFSSDLITTYTDEEQCFVGFGFYRIPIKTVRKFWPARFKFDGVLTKLSSRFALYIDESFIQRGETFLSQEDQYQILNEAQEKYRQDLENQGKILYGIFKDSEGGSMSDYLQWLKMLWIDFSQSVDNNTISIVDYARMYAKA